MKHIIKISIIVLMISACQKQNSPSEITIEGTYDFILQNQPNGSSIQLVEGDDNQAYGIIEWFTDRDTIKSSLSVDKRKDDSLLIEFENLNLKLAKSNAGYKGEITSGQNTEAVQLKFKSDSIHPDLEASKSLEVIDLDAEEASYIAFKNSEELYYTDWRKKLIYYAEKINNEYVSIPLNYDSERYKFSSVGYSKNKNILIVHGKDLSLKDQKGGSIYKLALKDETTVDSIITYPEEINTPTYDNFPDFTAEDNIIFSSWGNPDGEPNYGKGDIFISSLNDEGKYKTINISTNINTSIADAGASLAFNDRLMVFHRGVEESGYFSDKLFYSIYKNGFWSKAKRFEAPVNILYSYQYAPRIGSENKYLYYTSGHLGQGRIFRYPIEKLNLKFE